MYPTEIVELENSGDGVTFSALYKYGSPNVSETCDGILGALRLQETFNENDKHEME